MSAQNGSDHYAAELYSGGPYFDQLTQGQVFDEAPAVTLTSGLAATHQAIFGDRMQLSLDAHLSTAVTGSAAPVSNPGLVTDIAIGQSTVVTHHVKANLFYRGLRFHKVPRSRRHPVHPNRDGRTARNSSKPGRAPTGLAALRMTPTDQNGNTVLDFYRCAMLPLSGNPDDGRTRHDDDLSSIGPDALAPFATPREWNLDAYRNKVPGTHFEPAPVGSIHRSSGDVVSSAPELARLSLNSAATHHDERVGAHGRLVYGGHTIGIALAQATRALPNLVTVLGWHSCDHTGPVHEGDTLTSELHVESAIPLEHGTAVELRSLVFSHNSTATDTPVLDWRFTALMA